MPAGERLLGEPESREAKLCPISANLANVIASWQIQLLGGPMPPVRHS